MSPPPAGRKGHAREGRPGEALIDVLGLAPHPEGGWYRRTWVADAAPGRRPAGSAIYYLLLEGDVSAPHRIDAAEIWHFYAGDPLELTQEWPDGRQVVRVLGSDVLAGHAPQVVVEAGVWQSARPLGRYALVGATVSPAFTFEGFELRNTGADSTRHASSPRSARQDGPTDAARGGR
jgi:uncharacterized protein